jgi:cytochrome d ubiquinol oxidase subunit I
MSYHLMVMLSGYFILLMLGALFFTWRKRIERMRWLLWLLVLSIPLPIVAAELGWMSAEVGRQPWIVQGLLRTKDGISKSVSAGSIATTLTIFAVIYLILFVAWLRFFTGIVRKGPQEEAAPPAPQDAAPTDMLAR